MRGLALAGFAAGLAVPIWVGLGYGGHSPLALAMTLLILAAYLAGASEVWRFHHATGRLQAAVDSLQAPPEALDDWLASIDTSLRQAVRKRIDTGSSPLPGLVLAPYLVGLLVLLGMLGTFLGMVVTLKGAVLALESSTDLAAMRAALAAPVQGLSLAFGTSVAGVAASAMLGWISALARRERGQAQHGLDSLMATHLRAFARARQGEALLEAVQHQASQLPQVLAALQGLMTQMAQQQAEGNTRLALQQERLLAETRSAHEALGVTVTTAIRASAAETLASTGAAVEPLVARSLAGLNEHSREFQARVSQSLQAQAQALSAGFEQAITAAAASWRAALAQQQADTAQMQGELQAGWAQNEKRFEAQAATLLTTWGQAHTAEHEARLARDEARLSAWTRELAAISQTLQENWLRATSQAHEQQALICSTLESNAQNIQTRAQAQTDLAQAQLRQLIDQASAAPRAAAELAVQFRQQLSESVQRDQASLAERAQLTEALKHLIHSLTQTAQEQRSAIDNLVETSGKALQQLSEEVVKRMAAEAGQLSSTAAQVTVSAVEMASLGEYFHAAVQQFSRSSETLTEQLQKIETALSRSTARSDEQLAYYVAQARELIDLSLSAKQQIVADLRRLEPGAAEPAALEN